jgi:hypothetical protein
LIIIDEGRQIFFGTYEEVIQTSLTNFLGNLQQTKEQKPKETQNPEEKKFEIQSTTKDKKSLISEESAKGTVPFKIYSKFLMLGFKNIIIFLLVILLQILSQASYLSIIYWIVFWSNSSNQEDSSNIYGMAILVGILYFTTYLRVVSVTFPLLTSTEKLHNLAIKALGFTNSLYFDQNPTGRMLNRFAKDSSNRRGPHHVYT